MKVNNPNITVKMVWDYIDDNIMGIDVRLYVNALNIVGYKEHTKSGRGTYGGVHEFLGTLNKPQLSKLYNELRNIPK